MSLCLDIMMCAACLSLLDDRVITPRRLSGRIRALKGMLKGCKKTMATGMREREREDREHNQYEELEP